MTKNCTYFHKMNDYRNNNAILQTFKATAKYDSIVDRIDNADLCLLGEDKYLTIGLKFK